MQEAANHDAFLSAACMGFLALLFAVLLMPRGRAVGKVGGATEEGRGAEATAVDVRA